MRKRDVLEALRHQPEEFDLDKSIYTLYFRQKMSVALADADAGREISQEEFERLTDEWLV